MPEHGAQVMRDRTAADDQHTLFAQRTQRTPQREVPGRVLLRLQRKLRNGNIRLRKHDAQRHPRAMIEAVRVVQLHRNARLLQSLCRRLRPSAVRRARDIASGRVLRESR